MIIPTPSIEFDISDFVTKSSFVDSISKLIHIDSKPKSIESTSVNFGVESFVGYSKPKLFMASSNLEFVVEPKFPTILSKRCHLVEFQLFYWFLSEINGMKIIFGLVVLYFGLLMPTTNFFSWLCFWRSLIFGKTFLKIFLWVLFVLSSPFDGNFQSFGSFLRISIGFELVDVRQNGIWFKFVNVDK